MTTQKVACPTTIVQIERLMWPVTNAELSAIPVTMPGSAIGRTSRKETASRPKKRKRATPKAPAEPSASAMPVAMSPTRTESHNDVLTSDVQAAWNQLVLYAEIGQLCTFDLLNAYSMISASGTQRNSTTSADQTASVIRVLLCSIRAPRTRRACAR